MPAKEPKQEERLMENDDWHYCESGCGRRHFDHDETLRCSCGSMCHGYAAGSSKPYDTQLLMPGVCRVCGCDDDNACSGGCFWVDAEHMLCSQCARAS
jgi:hypothetical protein